VHIAANKNTVPGDVSAMVPGGIRMGNMSSYVCFQFNLSLQIVDIISIVQEPQLLRQEDLLRKILLRLLTSLMRQ
jgi:glycine/serine hydroxymethyltransferase